MSDSELPPDAGDSLGDGIRTGRVRRTAPLEEPGPCLGRLRRCVSPSVARAAAVAATAAAVCAGPAMAEPLGAADAPAAAPGAAAPPKTYATIAPSFSPDRLGARGALTFTVRYGGGELGVPSAVRRTVLQFPAGLGLDVPQLRSCSAARLRARGARGCPAQAEIGRGHALVAAPFGALTITEDVNLWAFIGPPQNAAPTVEILAEGITPREERMVLTGTVLPDHAPYGEELVVSVPPSPRCGSSPTSRSSMSRSRSARAAATARPVRTPS